MCLLGFGWRAHADYPLVLVANRDEYHERPTAELGFWEDAPQLCAGRDLRQGGTWLGATRSGRVAALTNFREMPLDNDQGRPSRGALVADFLTGSRPAAECACEIAARAEQFSGFNLLIGDGAELWYLSNRDAAGPRSLAPGYYGLSNGLLDAPWPKLQAARENLRELLEQNPHPSTAQLLGLLARTDAYPDHELPDTGVGPELERLLSSPFIRTPSYGTRCTTALTMGSRMLSMVERRFDPSGQVVGEELFSFDIAT